APEAGRPSRLAGPCWGHVQGVSKREHDLDQEWGELIEENRLALPGTQVLFAFLLVLPFQQRFERLDDGQVAVYYAALICAAIAIILLIAPTAAHRIRWRQGDKEGLLRLSTKTGIAPAAFLAGGRAARGA